LPVGSPTNQESARGFDISFSLRFLMDSWLGAATEILGS
jgi:hypothetical protein